MVDINQTDPNDSAYGPTLAQLAAAAQADPNNPAYVNPASPYGSPTPAQVTANNASINAPATHNGAVLGADSGPSALTKDALAFVKNDELPPNTSTGGIAPLLDKTNVTTPVPGASLATTGVATSGVNTGNQLSPERLGLKLDNEVRDTKKGLLDQETGINTQNKYLAQVGLEAANKAVSVRDANFQLDNMKEDLSKYQANQATQERKRLLEQEAEEVRTAKVDPNHWFKDRGTAGSILAAISMAAGAFAAAMPHAGSNQNFALNIINDSISRDVEAQKENIALKWKHLNYQGEQDEKEYVRSNYFINKMNEAKYKDFDHAGYLINEMKQNTNDQITIQNLDKLQLGIQGKKADLDKEGNDQMINVLKYERSQRGTDPNSAANLEKDWHKYVTEAQIEQAKNPKAPGPISKEEWFKIHRSGGSSNGASGPKLDAKEQDAVNSVDEFTKAADRAQEILRDTSYANSPKGRAELDQLQRNLTLAYPKTQTGSTRINEMELKKGEETFKGLGGVIRSDMLGTNGVTLQVLKDQAKDRKNRILTGKGGVSTEVPGATPVEE